MILSPPTLNAALNATSAVFLSLGFIAIKRKNILIHRICMLSAFVASTLFLGSYIAYHLRHGATHFLGTGGVRYFYFSLLLLHTVMALLIVPMVLCTLFCVLRGNFIRHRAIARWTWPCWMFVSVSGVVVYWFLYHYPHS